MGFLERYGWFIVLAIIILVFLWHKLKPYLRDLHNRWERQREIANFGKWPHLVKSCLVFTWFLLREVWGGCWEQSRTVHINSHCLFTVGSYKQIHCYDLELTSDLAELDVPHGNHYSWLFIRSPSHVHTSVQRNIHCVGVSSPWGTQIYQQMISHVWHTNLS